MASAVSWHSRRNQPSPPPRLIPALVYVARLGSRINLGAVGMLPSLLSGYGQCRP